MSTPMKLVVLISGSGTNLQAVIDKINSHDIDARICRVIANRKSAYGLQRAKDAGIPTTYHNLLKYKSARSATADDIQAAREEYDLDLARIVLQETPDVVACLGFLHVLSTKFLDPLNTAGVRIINLHPALPGTFSGSNAIERAHRAWKEGKIDKTGVMVHEVIPEVDMGTPIVVREIPLVKKEHEELFSLEQHVHRVEWEAVVHAIAVVGDQLKKSRLEYTRNEIPPGHQLIN